jgi:hypothetical protein
MILIAYDGQIELEDDDWNDDDSGDEDEWECCFPDRCLVPHFDHHSSECYDLEMAEALHEEMMREVDSSPRRA